MKEAELDQEYLDEIFINKTNQIDDEQFANLANLILENYNNEATLEQISYLTRYISDAYGNEIDSATTLRKLKYLVHKGMYNRLSKKFKNDLLSINLEESKIEVLIEVQKNYFEKIAEQMKKNGESQNLKVRDFQVTTNMPVYTSNYKLKQDGFPSLNEDLKKQNLLINFQLSGPQNIEESENLGNQNNKNLVLEINKLDLINFYEEIEKIQEKLDKLF
jgi:hypothetical protein